MSRRKAATCIHCETKNARIGKGDGSPTHLFCTTRCAVDYAIKVCVDDQRKWCPACGDWTDDLCKHAPPRPYEWQWSDRE